MSNRSSILGNGKTSGFVTSLRALYSQHRIEEELLYQHHGACTWALVLFHSVASFLAVWHFLAYGIWESSGLFYGSQVTSVNI